MGLFPDLTMLFQCGIVVLAQLCLQICLQVRSFLSRPARNRFGPYMSLISPLLHVPFNGGQGDAKHLHNLGF
jgi:hypothetical protein